MNSKTGCGCVVGALLGCALALFVACGIAFNAPVRGLLDASALRNGIGDAMPVWLVVAFTGAAVGGGLGAALVYITSRGKHGS
jgi:hypothetical protein